jgi:hypothetical protein
MYDMNSTSLGTFHLHSTAFLTPHQFLHPQPHSCPLLPLSKPTSCSPLSLSVTTKNRAHILFDLLRLHIRLLLSHLQSKRRLTPWTSALPSSPTILLLYHQHRLSIQPRQATWQPCPFLPPPTPQIPLTRPHPPTYRQPLHFSTEPSVNSLAL